MVSAIAKQVTDRIVRIGRDGEAGERDRIKLGRRFFRMAEAIFSEGKWPNDSVRPVETSKRSSCEQSVSSSWLSSIMWLTILTCLVGILNEGEAKDVSRKRRGRFKELWSTASKFATCTIFLSGLSQTCTHSLCVYWDGMRRIESWHRPDLVKLV